jgi:SNF2 family DNA or RNA helicase
MWNQVKNFFNNKEMKSVSPKRSTSPKRTDDKVSKKAISPKRATSKILSKSRSKYSKIDLKTEQIPQVKNIIEILKNNICAFDMSMMGAGKTYVSSEIAVKFGFKRVIVICPASVVGKWKMMKSTYGVPIQYVMSYEMLRSTKDHQPYHGLLKRFDEIINERSRSVSFRPSGEDGIPVLETRHQVRFEATDKLKEIVKEGCLFIFDEAQKVKNKNAQWYAAKTIAETLIEISGKSRFLLLSGTPIDKEEHALNIMNMMGFIRSRKLYTTDEGKIILIGAKELILFCEKVNKKATEDTLASYPIRVKEDVNKLCYYLFQNVIKKYMTSSMPPPKISNVNIDTKNGYYIMESETDKVKLRNAIDTINRTLRKRIYRRADGNIYNNPIQKLGGVVKQLMLIEALKVPIFVRLAKQKLQENPNAKVALFVNYTSNLDALIKDLSIYNPIKFNGQVSKDERQILINKFQEPNNDYRLFIGNIGASATGIDLDDKYGNFPRYAYASPNFSILDLHQLTRRFYRLDTKSNSVFRFVYVKGFSEVNILNNLAKKSNVMKDTLTEQVEGGIKFPGEYENEIE